MNALVFGGYGVFGRLVCEGLAARGIAVTVVGRDEARARAIAHALGPAHSALAADVHRPETYRAALAARPVVVHCAGPFRDAELALLDACLAARCHFVDFAENRAFVAAVRAREADLSRAGLCAITGASSLPGISLALIDACRAPEKPPADSARVTLFIGNRNDKGDAAVSSAVQTIGRPIRTAEHTLRGFADPESIHLPPPFGKRRVYNFESPEYDLLPERFGIASVRVKVGFERSIVGTTFHLLSRLSARPGPGIARLFGGFGRALSSRGSAAGVVLVELFSQDRPARSAFAASDHGQRMAALPCILAAARLCRAEPPPRPGAHLAHELLGTTALLNALRAEAGAHVVFQPPNE